MKMKKSIYLFSISFMVTACILFENTVKTAYGEYKHAVDIEKGGIRIFDFEYKF